MAGFPEALMKAIIEQIENSHNCRICMAPKNGPNAHPTIDCPNLGTDLTLRFNAIMNRLFNLPSFHRGMDEGRYPRIDWTPGQTTAGNQPILRNAEPKN